ncbi:Phosphate transport (Pho88), putative [Leishmania lindenbergi]|uniref:Phosphate transport (Pho88) n=1 Tax=Leishmania lindenbergi TaxID=651832 RepID=A0AAW3A218_9TRYP
MNLFLHLTVLIVSWSLDSTDPDIQHRIYFTFVVVHVAIAFTAIYIFFSIWRCDDDTLIRVKDPYTDKESIQKHWEYDLGKLRDLTVSSIGLPAVLSAFLASTYGIFFPLLLQSLNNPKALYQSELFRLHVKGEKAERDLLRPWKESNVIPEWAKALWNRSEKSSEKLLTGSGVGQQSPTGGSKASHKRR